MPHVLRLARLPSAQEPVDMTGGRRIDQDVMRVPQGEVVDDAPIIPVNAPVGVASDCEAHVGLFD